MHPGQMFDLFVIAVSLAGLIFSGRAFLHYNSLARKDSNRR